MNQHTRHFSPDAAAFGSGTSIDGRADIRVIGAGFGRTGTFSLKSALERLGFSPCCHMLEVAWRPEKASQWLAAAEGYPVNWRDVLRGYRATVDWPGCAFYKEIMATFPDAKVILTVRDPEAWYESAKQTVHARPASRPPQPDDEVGVRMVRAVVWNGSMQGKFEDRYKAMEIFNRHIEDVKRTVPSDRLLVYEVKQGWEPLCTFLGVDVPAEPFPHLNERDVFNDPQQFDKMVEEIRSRRFE